MVTTKAKGAIVRTNVSDPVADLLARLRNANLAYKTETLTPVSKLNKAVLDILVREGYVAGFEKEGDGVHVAFRVQLKYGKDRERVITGLERRSTPGRRMYAKRGELPRVLGGLGIAIISTSQGVMTDKEASKKGVGGEILAYVW
jgi:small subunit ribosomal protein S8